MDANGKHAIRHVQRAPSAGLTIPQAFHDGNHDNPAAGVPPPEALTCDRRTGPSSIRPGELCRFTVRTSMDE
jgi:hypothetical protein